MILQGRHIADFQKAADVLYVLEAVNKLSDGIVSKISLQKLLYLSIVLAPIKDVIINFLKYHYNYRGPFNPDVQNMIDHLVGLKYVKIEDYVVKSSKISYVNYKITEQGSFTVSQLQKLSREQDKFWWIKTVTKLSITYSNNTLDSEWSGLEKIVDLVYQDPTFLEGKTHTSFRHSIDFGEGSTSELINFSKEFLKMHDLKVCKENEREIAEFLLTSFFEFLFIKVLNKNYGKGA